LIITEIQSLQLRELSQRLWQRRQLVLVISPTVAPNIKLLQIRELTDRFWQLGKFHVSEVKFLCPRAPRCFDFLFCFAISFVTRHVCRLSCPVVLFGKVEYEYIPVTQKVNQCGMIQNCQLKIEN
jgi:hypothetical protein